jgi:two-component system, OmpR family, response regulator QseB
MKKKVLIIEDDRDLANLFKLVLEMIGFEANTVHDGTRGVDALMNNPLPEAIMLDMHLPGISGEEIYSMLAERGEAHRVLVCSADVQLVETYRSNGAKTVVKPVPVSELQQMIQRIVDQPRYENS